LEGGFVIVIMGIYNSIVTAIGTLIAWLGKINLSGRGHSKEYHMYMENNGCPPPSYYDYDVDESAHTYRIRHGDRY